MASIDIKTRQKEKLYNNYIRRLNSSKSPSISASFLSSKLWNSPIMKIRITLCVLCTAVNGAADGLL